MKTFICRYYHKGKWWALDITADDFTDAEARASKLGNLQVLGELYASIPAFVPLSGTISTLFVRLMNYIEHKIK